MQREASFLTRFGVVEVWHQLLLLSGITLVVWLLESVFQYAYGERPTHRVHDGEVRRSGQHGPTRSSVLFDDSLQVREEVRRAAVDGCDPDPMFAP